MPLDQKAIDELKEIHFQEFGEKLTNEEAWDMGISLLRLFKALCQYGSRNDNIGQDNLTGERGSRYD